MPKYVLKPKNELRLIKEMLIDSKLDPDAVLNDWLSNYWNQEIPTRPWELKDCLQMFKLMFVHAGHDLEECLEDWKENYRVKQIRTSKEKLNLKQTRIMKIFEKHSDKALGINLRDYNGR